MKAFVATALLACAGLAQAAQTVELKLAGEDGPGKSIGTISIEQNKYGTLLTPGTPLTVALDNRGLPAASTPFILRRGGHQNDETGTLH